MELKNQDGLTEKEFLEQYKPGVYERPSVTVDMLIFTVEPGAENQEPELLLIKRKDHPHMGKWALPGGFVQMDESLEEAAARELQEETGLEGIYMEQLYTCGAVERDPRMRVISVAYIAVVPKDQLSPQASDDADDADWFQVKKDKLADTETEETYILSVENDEKHIFMGYRISQLYQKQGLMWKKETSYELVPEVEGEGAELAFDHAILLNMALDRLDELVKMI